jgi:hemerythrin-like domain-containing protein
MTALAFTLTIAASVHAAGRPTEPFRAEHVEVKEHLAHIDAMIGSLPTSPATSQRQTMAMVANFLHEHIRKHAEWEEAKLYPAIDRRTQDGKYPFTASMRYEHRIVGRGIDDLAARAKAETLDPLSFSRAADRLVGLIQAHFEKEEEVFLPILDATMSKEEFEKELGESAH